MELLSIFLHKDKKAPLVNIIRVLWEQNIANSYLLDRCELVGRTLAGLRGGNTPLK